MPVEIPGAIPFTDDRNTRQLRRRRGAPLLAGAGGDGAGVQGVPDAFRRQVEPRPPLLGSARPRVHPLLGSHRTARIPAVPQLRSARDARGLLARGQQRRLLARRAASEGVFYSYAYPEPSGYRDEPHRASTLLARTTSLQRVRPALRGGAHSGDPDATLLEFLQSTYEAAANRAEWDRSALERAY